MQFIFIIVARQTWATLTSNVAEFVQWAIVIDDAAMNKW